MDLGAVVVAADPHVDVRHIPAGVDLVKADPDELGRADLVVSLVDHDAFDAESVVQHAPQVLDCKNWLTGENVETL